MSKPRQSVVHVPVGRLTAHPANIRKDLGDLTEMARSVAEHGILQPLTATEDPGNDGNLLLLAGHRRLGAAIMAHLDVLPVIIRHGLNDPAEQLVVMLVENTQRKDLNAMDRAEAYGVLRDRGLSTTEIARRTGTHFTTVSYYLNLLLLTAEERQEVRSGAYKSTEAVADVRERRQEARQVAGTPLRGRPRTGAWFSPQHRLAPVVRRACTHRGTTNAGVVGESGCGPCWEQAIRDEPASQPASQPADFDEAVVIRRLNGDHAVRTRNADRIEIVRRAQLRGMSLLEIERVTGLTKADRYTERGLEAS
jgi:ParB family chromosome partitioning protein